MSETPLDAWGSLAQAPLFGELLVGEPHAFDFSSANPQVAEYAVGDFARFQRQVEEELARAGKSWGLGAYREERALLLRDFPQMTATGRVIHAGLDIIVPEGAVLHAPLAGSVHLQGLDAGAGNYGGYLILHHQAGRDHAGAEDIYSFYGHLASDFPHELGQHLQAGEPFARIGAHADSGLWFTHTHLQWLTPAAVAAGRLTEGYVTRAEASSLPSLYPDPAPLFRRN